MSSLEYYDLLEKIRCYEINIYNQIKSHLFYKFKNNLEFKNAIRLWFDDKYEAFKKYGDISLWDVSNVTDMSFIFAHKKYFNDNISYWDVRNVTNMERMFKGTTSFNQDISNWVVSNVKDMDYIF